MQLNCRWNEVYRLGENKFAISGGGLGHESKDCRHFSGQAGIFLVTPCINILSHLNILHIYILKQRKTGIFLVTPASIFYPKPCLNIFCMLICKSEFKYSFTRCLNILWQPTLDFHRFSASIFFYILHQYFLQYSLQPVSIFNTACLNIYYSLP